MAGYSGTPLLKKLGIKDGHRVALLHAPAGWELPDQSTLMDGAGPARSLRGKGQFSVILAFFERAAALQKRLPSLAARMQPTGGLWVAWPKKASGMATDLSFDIVQNAGLDLGLVDNKICAVDDTWSGLRFVIRRKDR